jgi:hypothetical protein
MTLIVNDHDGRCWPSKIRLAAYDCPRWHAVKWTDREEKADRLNEADFNPELGGSNFPKCQDVPPGPSLSKNTYFIDVICPKR